jgi:dolichol kinase
MALSTGWRAEITRKVLHVSTTLVALLYAYCPRETMLWLLGGALLVSLATEALRHTRARFRTIFRRAVGYMVRRSEWGRICGATYVLTACLLSVWLFPKRTAIAVILVLSISDSAASLVGLRFGRQKFLGKSLAGSGAFFITALAILWATFPEHPGVALAAALTGTLAEAIPPVRFGPFELSDNLTIPLLTGAAVSLLLAASA